MTVTKAKITDYELIDHGVENHQYFQGCGVAYTRFTDAVTGCGENFAEALEDALTQIAENNMDSNDLEQRIRADEGYTDKPWPETPSATSVFQKHNPDAQDEDGEWDYDDCALYYYVSIRYMGYGRCSRSTKCNPRESVR